MDPYLSHTLHVQWSVLIILEEQFCMCPNCSIAATIVWKLWGYFWTWQKKERCCSYSSHQVMLFVAFIVFYRCPINCFALSYRIWVDVDVLCNGVSHLCRFLNPLGMFLGGAVVSLVFMVSVWAGENKNFIKNFKKKNPTLFVIAVMGTSYFLLSLCGGVMVFIFGITFPLLCESQYIPHSWGQFLGHRGFICVWRIWPLMFDFC